MASSEIDAVIPAALPAGDETALHNEHAASLAFLVLGALGVVFGDIGTSPLYTLKECLIAAEGEGFHVADLYGILSLMLWALVMVVTVKYLCFVMRADHHGEGGIFAALGDRPRSLPHAYVAQGTHYGHGSAGRDRGVTALR